MPIAGKNVQKIRKRLQSPSTPSVACFVPQIEHSSRKLESGVPRAVRDWNGPAKAAVAADQHAVVNARTEQQTFDDLVRNWGG